MENRRYLVSFGDSTEYCVSYPGTKEEFENSDKFRAIKDAVSSYLKQEFPTGGYEDVVAFHVADDNGMTGYTDLDSVSMDDLLKSVKRQVEVMREGKELNNNAPFDN